MTFPINTVKNVPCCKQLKNRLLRGGTEVFSVLMAFPRSEISEKALRTVRKRYGLEMMSRLRVAGDLPKPLPDAETTASEVTTEAV